jgi:hypothetical protein
MDGDGEDKVSGNGDGKGDDGVYDNNGNSGGGGGDDATMTRLQRQWTVQRRRDSDVGNEDGNVNSNGMHDGCNSNANRRHIGNSNSVMAT